MVIKALSFLFISIVNLDATLHFPTVDKQMKSPTISTFNTCDLIGERRNPIGRIAFPVATTS